MDWYKHDIGSYKRKTHGLSALEDGIYRRLLDEYYAGSGPLPNDLPTLKSLARIRGKWEVKAMSKVIDKFFPLNGDGYRHNKRADEEISDYMKVCETNRKNRKGRTVNEPSTSRQGIDPPSEVVSKQRSKEGCQGYLENGQRCGQPTNNKLGAQWLCQEHHPYLK